MITKPEYTYKCDATNPRWVAGIIESYKRILSEGGFVSENEFQLFLENSNITKEEFQNIIKDHE